MQTEWTETRADGVSFDYPGSPVYFSPEHAVGTALLTPAADVYALGVIGFEMLTGRFPRPSALDQPIEPIGGDAPDWLKALITRMLAYDYRVRPKTGEAVALAIRDGLQHEREQEGRRIGRMAELGRKLNAVLAAPSRSEADLAEADGLLDELVQLAPSEPNTLDLSRRLARALREGSVARPPPPTPEPIKPLNRRDRLHQEAELREDLEPAQREKRWADVVRISEGLLDLVPDDPEATVAMQVATREGVKRDREIARVRAALRNLVASRAWDQIEAGARVLLELLPGDAEALQARADLAAELERRSVAAARQKAEDEARATLRKVMNSRAWDSVADAAAAILALVPGDGEALRAQADLQVERERVAAHAKAVAEARGAMRTALAEQDLKDAADWAAELLDLAPNDTEALQAKAELQAEGERRRIADDKKRAEDGAHETLRRVLVAQDWDQMQRAARPQLTTTAITTLKTGDLILNKEFRILELIGKGEFGDVYRALDVRLNVERAVKTLRADAPSAVFGHARKRFLLEAQLGAQPDHSNIIRVYRFSEDADQALYMVMELAAGVPVAGGRARSLKDLLALRGPLPVSQTVNILVDACAGLSALHETLGAVHRDVKPGNILLDGQGRAKIADLGVAQTRDLEPGAGTRGTRLVSLPHPGTPEYASPEHRWGDIPLLPTSDVYSLGCVAFEMLTGKLWAKEQTRVRGPRDLRGMIPVWLDDIVVRMLCREPYERVIDSKNPLRRYASARVTSAVLRLARDQDMKTRSDEARAALRLALDARAWTDVTNAAAALLTLMSDDPVAFKAQAEAVGTGIAPILQVDPLGRGDHTTLGEAVEAARPGTLVLVHPGLYAEGVVIKKAVDIIGVGDSGGVIVEASDTSVVKFQAERGLIANLTIRCTTTHWGNGVDIYNGKLELESCDITSQSLACVTIHKGASPTLRGNRIQGGDVGVYIYPNGQGTLEDNDIFAYMFAGVLISTGGNPTLRRNKIHDGVFDGVHVDENGQGTLEDNEISANMGGGVHIKSGGRPTLRRNRISANRFEAIWIEDAGGGVFEMNDLRGNGRAWTLDPGAETRITRVGNLE